MLPLYETSLSGAASATPAESAPLERFTLRWLHSVEKIPWEEHWSVTPQGLRLGRVRIEGTGAGMEPPPDARVINGGIEYSAADRPPVDRLILPDSDFTGPITLCREDATGCQPLRDLIHRSADDPRPLVVSPCRGG